MNTTKGYKTSEFWIVIASLIVSALVLLKVVPADSQDNLTPFIADGLEKLVALIISLSTIITYIRSRTELKKQEIASTKGE
jgi:membrane protein YdbS with pleckstrin-like domain